MSGMFAVTLRNGEVSRKRPHGCLTAVVEPGDEVVLYVYGKDAVDAGMNARRQIPGFVDMAVEPHDC